MDEGGGLLADRAWRANVVGPSRLSLGLRKGVELSSTEGRLIAKNIASADVYLFIGVALPFGAPTNPLAVVFSKDEMLGVGSVPALLIDHMGNSTSVFGFMQLLLPGEEIFGQITNPAQATQRVVVARAMF